ncbi:4898_t:CDS:2, partial [Gigaspora rosea]
DEDDEGDKGNEGDEDDKGDEEDNEDIDRRIIKRQSSIAQNSNFDKIEINPTKKTATLKNNRGEIVLEPINPIEIRKAVINTKLPNFERNTSSISDTTISTAITSEDVTDSFSRTSRPSPKNFISDTTISTAITSEDVTNSFSRTCRPSPKNFVTTGL